MKTNSVVLLKKYYDKVGRIVSVFKNTETRKYTIDARLYSNEGKALAFTSYTFPNRKSCMEELKRYPRETDRRILKNKP